MTLRALIVCPGRGSYGPRELGLLARATGQGADLVARADALLADTGGTPVSALDRREAFDPELMQYGQGASTLTFAASAVDLSRLDRARVRPVAVVGNSMGWYTALYAAGVLGFEDALRLVATMGELQAMGEGGQLIYPLCDEDWLASAELEAAVEAGLEASGARWSVRLGALAVLAGREAELAALEAALPAARLGSRGYPARIPHHAAFHTPLMGRTASAARERLLGLAWTAPQVPLIDGRGVQHRPLWSAPSDLAAYTLGPQVVEAFDFGAALRVALREYAPDVVVLLGPGESLGLPVISALLREGWRGARDRDAFFALQRGESPLLLALARPDQAARVCAR